MNERKEYLLPIFIQPRVSFITILQIFIKTKQKIKKASFDQRKRRQHIEWSRWVVSPQNV
jgi:hypothetical protein